MLVDFHLAELILKEQTLDRAVTLKRGRILYNRFLTLCDTYDLLSASDKSAFERGASAVSAPLDPAARRNKKIAKYKAEKDLKAKIEVCYANPRLENCPIVLNSNSHHSNSPQTPIT